MKRAALFVGVNNYCDKGINNLSCAVNDACATADFFAGKGFETHLMTDSEVSFLAVRNKITGICSSLKAGDVFVFYFSGHGHESGDNHFLLCPEASTLTLDIDGGGDAVSLAAVRRFSENCCEAGVHRLFILDCCRNNVRAGAKDVYKASGGKGIELVALDNGDGILPPWILRSCQAGQRSFEDVSCGHGYFTLALGKTLEETQIKNFPAFFDMLKRKMQQFIHPGEQRITLGEYSGGSFPLFADWDLPEETAFPAGSAAPQVAQEYPLPSGERSRFYALMEEVKRFYIKEVAPLDLPEKYQHELSKIRRDLDKVQKEQPSHKAVQELQELRSGLEFFKNIGQQKRECTALNKQADLEIKVFKDAKLPLPQECCVLRSSAQEAQERGDWEAALPLCQALLEALLKEKNRMIPFSGESSPEEMTVQTVVRTVPEISGEPAPSAVDPAGEPAPSAVDPAGEGTGDAGMRTKIIIVAAVVTVILLGIAAVFFL